ncbi:hypothetical protein [Sphingobium bisphenolivorans]|uniref:hypothetical protein n=1 Tax=Sphingobium bisphenolivorans TaxID=1335760 RepID=UPI00039A8BB0|nr:hypothetical protein [Sphingobium bisphenolivorans]
MRRAAFRIAWAKRLAMATAALSLAYVQCAQAQSLILPEGMRIQLETRQDISSKSAKVGDQVELAVAKAVTIGGVTLIPAGTPVVGEVAQARDNGLFGRSGKLNISVSKVKAGQAEVPVRGEWNAKGGSGTLGSVGAGVVFLPLAFLVRGKEVKLPAGTAFDVYVDREVTLASEAPATLTAAQIAADVNPPTTAIRAIDPNDALAR